MGQRRDVDELAEVLARALSGALADDGRASGHGDGGHGDGGHGDGGHGDGGHGDRSGVRLGAALVRRDRGEVVRSETARRAGAGEDLRVVLADQAAIRADARARRAPWLATGVTAAAGWSATGIGTVAMASGGTGALVLSAPVVAGLCVVAVGLLWLLCGSRIPRRLRRRVLAGAAGATAWVTTCTLLGAGSWTMTALLLAGCAAASTSWCRAHAVPDPVRPQGPVYRSEPLPDDDAQVVDLAEILAQRWADNVAQPRRAAPGTRLTGRDDLPNAVSWTIQCPPGESSFAELYAVRGRIASGLRQPGHRVLIEPSETDESQARLTVITRDVLAEGIAFTGPRYERRPDGSRVVPLGPYADGDQEACWVAVDGVGCRSGLVTGAPGSGKSVCLESVGMGLKDSGEWSVIFGDGDPDGGSSDVLNRVADWAEAGPDGVLAQLAALEDALRVRGMLKATLTEGPDGTPVPITDPATQPAIRKLLPCPEFPAVIWILDELHRLTTDPRLKDKEKLPARLERLVRLGRKYGIVVGVGTQSLLAPDFGNSTTLRGYLATKNLLAFRNSNKGEKATVAGLEINPATLPDAGGYAFSAGSGRLAMFRTAYAPDMTAFVPGLAGAGLDPDTTRAIAAHRPHELDAHSRHAEQLALLTAWRTGQPLPADTHTVAAATATAGLVSGLAGLRAPAPLGAANVIPLHPRTPVGDPSPATATTGTAAAVGPVEQVDDDADVEMLGSTQQAVLAALREGYRGTGEIAAHIGRTTTVVSRALGALADLHLAHKRAHGQWAPGAPAPAARAQ